MTTITIERSVLEQALESMCWAARTLDIDPDEAQNYHRSLENIRAALAAPATAPEPIQLRQGECWPESTMAQWDYYRKLIAEGDTSSAPRDWFESLAEMRLIAAPATAPEQPSWHDAPNAPGLWVCRQAYTGNMQAFEVTDPDALNRTLGIEGRWFGPVPPDSGDKPR